MGQNIQDRMLQIIDNEYNGIKKGFYEEMKISKGTLAAMFSRRSNPSFELIYKILKKHRNINADWLILGEGKMYKSDVAMVKESEFIYSSNQLDHCKEQLSTAQKEIEYLKDINKLLRGQK